MLPEQKQSSYWPEAGLRSSWSRKFWYFLAKVYLLNLQVYSSANQSVKDPHVIQKQGSDPVKVKKCCYLLIRCVCFIHLMIQILKADNQIKGDFSTEISFVKVLIFSCIYPLLYIDWFRSQKVAMMNKLFLLKTNIVRAQSRYFLTKTIPRNLTFIDLDLPS